MEEEYILTMFKRAFKLITPSKKHPYPDELPDYTQGWNDCVTRMRRRKKLYLKNL